MPGMLHCSFLDAKMKAREIIEQLAREAAVEKLVANITGQPVDGDLPDLCQMIYEILLNTEPEKIERLYAAKARPPAATGLHSYIVRIIKNQLRSVTSPFYYIYRLPQTRQVPLTELLAQSQKDET